MTTLGIIGIISLAILIFIVARELMCWYYKINEMITILKSIDSKLEKIDTTKS
jgi:hypothetical protein